MVRSTNTKRKLFAVIFLIVFGCETFYPGIAFALTSGPSQPEMEKFEAAGVNDMVDLFSGDFKENIPLLDVGGYPVNLSYQSGAGVEDEASWVGMGWALNPGAVTRNMRGIPDDFKGDVDQIKRTYHQKDFKKIGASLVIKPSIFAWETGRASLKIGLYKDNYYGMGATVGASLSTMLAGNTKSKLTAGLDLDVNSDSRNGLSISPTLEINGNFNKNKEHFFPCLTGGFTYNSRAGLKDLSLGISFNSKKRKYNQPLNVDRSAVHYFGQSHTPDIENNSANSQYTFSLDGGVTLFSIYFGLGGSGYVYNEHITDEYSSVPAYGYLHYLQGRSNTNAMLDFNREKDGVFLPSTPAIAVPVATEDFFMATGQGGSQQFRPYFSGDYVVFDRAHSNSSLQLGAGVTLGGGNLNKFGGRIDLTTGGEHSGKWLQNNAYSLVAEPDFTTGATPVTEPVYFKQTGEHTVTDMSVANQLGGDQVVSVAIGGNTAFAAYRPPGIAYATSITNPMKKDPTKRDIRNQVFSYLTASQAANFGLDKNIIGDNSSDGLNRVNSYRKGHHISEITITGNDGKRTVYGIPVYNHTQSDVTFSSNPGQITNVEQTRRDGLITYTPSTDADPDHNTNGRDNMYSKEVIPGYATSYLLTGILSPDYVDVTGDGISDDDLGTAVKLGYNKTTTTNLYKWRTPYCLDPAHPQANYNEGFLSDPKDDRASYSYGEKELWYLKTIESKTMIAVFETSDRDDALGVQGETGGRDETVRPQKLDKITLYSKADWIRNGTSATPIKVVHFEYDYSLVNGIDSKIIGMPNNRSGGGKLTLKKIYFTFGTSTRGQTNPYNFSYDVRPINDGTIAGLPTISDANDPEGADGYAPRQEDRWGTYKQSFYNKVLNGKRVWNNSEFPYSIQEDVTTGYSERALADKFASKWQLNQIITPTFALIKIAYESDDYAYVQDRRAQQMCSLNVDNGTTGLLPGKSTYYALKVNLPYQVSGLDDFKKRYLEGLDKIFFKAYVDIDNRNHYEYIHGYASVDLAHCDVSSSGYTATVALVSDDINPITKIGWQTLQTSLPQYAYDNYDNSDVGDGTGAILALVQAFANYGELFRSFNDRAADKHFSSMIDFSKSMIRLNNPDYKKIGGGNRVHKISITDQWSTMASEAGASGSKDATYGKIYDYTKIGDDGTTIISSGVASYEPQIGNEENPFHEPIDFAEKVYWGHDKYHYIEKPFCETYFPAPEVGYSKVTETSFGDNDQTGQSKEAGYTENEFYTARDFPTIVENTTLSQINYENSLIVRLFSGSSVNRVTTSQGFKVELNDMHGKPKSVKVFDKNGNGISSDEYFYSVTTDTAQTSQLNNQVSVLNSNGTISSAMVGTDIDLVSDVRESVNQSTGTSIGAYAGGMIITLGFIPLPIYFPYAAINFDMTRMTDSYNSVSNVKVIHRYGIMKKVRTMEKGSVTETENLLWDGTTGQVLLTKGQNEFDDYTYAFHYPAYMVQDFAGMGAAYQNLGATFNITTSSNGVISCTGLNYLFPGDELMLGNNQKGWVMKSNDGSLRLIDKDGNFISVTNSVSIIQRSGRRNLLSASAGLIVCMNNPIQDGSLNLGVDKKILDAKSQTYSELWGVPVPDCSTGNTYTVFSSPPPSSPPPPPPNNFLNPYYRDILGNWHSLSTYLYSVNRQQIPGIPTQNGGTDIRHSGNYNSFTPFWQFSSNGLFNNAVATNDDRWDWSSKSIYFDQKGNEIESVNTLNIYNSALFGYSASVATAVATNARHNEIAYDGFEDYFFNLSTNNQIICAAKRQIDWNIGSSNIVQYPEPVHTGKYSCKVPNQSDLSFTVTPGSATPPPSTSILSYDATSGAYVLGINEQAKGYEPVVSKKQLLSFWVYDGVPTDDIVQNVNVYLNNSGSPLDLSTQQVAVSEGWKKLEIIIPENFSALKIQAGGADIYIDDIRLMPKDADMKTYVYDDITMRLLAQLDQNNFATIYEYDEEGTPVRIKRETEKGIMTIKESRMSRRNQ